jgi:2-pyrone-4,6-dicarboxylate lactonase
VRADIAGFGGQVVTAPVWDCHVHIFEPAYPFAAVRSYTPAAATIGELRDHLHRVGAGHAVLVQASPHGSDNRAILDALEILGGAHRAVISPAPDLDARRLRELRAAGVRGLRLNPLGRIERVSDTIVRLVRESGRLAADAGLALELAATPRAILALAGEIRALPCDLVLPHLAGLPTRGLARGLAEELAALLKERQVWLKVSGTERYDAPERVAADLRALLAAMPDRLVWGSDWPHTPLHRAHVAHDAARAPHRVVDDAQAKAALQATLSAEDCERLFITNPASLYG